MYYPRFHPYYYRRPYCDYYDRYRYGCYPYFDRYYPYHSYYPFYRY